MGSLDSSQITLGKGDYIINGSRPLRRRRRHVLVPTPCRDHVNHAGGWLIVALGFYGGLIRDGRFGPRSWSSDISSQVAPPDERFDFILQLVALLGVVPIVTVVPAVLLHISLRRGAV